jgi:predicted dehydrogenase
VHYDAAKEFLRRGIHVICDKPLTSNLADAKKLKKIADESGALFILTHNYTGYPMVRQAREMIANGELGDIRLVQAEYPQDWLTEAVEQQGAKQAVWRTDPAQSGAGGSTGDIGTHAYNLGCFVSGLELDSLAADLDSFVEGRRLDDNAHVMLRYKAKGKEKPAKGMLWCSQVAPGHENGLKVRVYGTKGGIEWVQADPNYLWFTPFGEPKRLITRNGAGSGAAAARVSRVPSGHPEGYLEAFATIYTEAAHAINAAKKGKPVDKAVVYPTVDDGVKGVAFVEACVASSKKNGGWVKV